MNLSSAPYRETQANFKTKQIEQIFSANRKQLPAQILADRKTDRGGIQTTRRRSRDQRRRLEVKCTTEPVRVCRPRFLYSPVAGEWVEAGSAGRGLASPAVGLQAQQPLVPQYYPGTHFICPPVMVGILSPFI